MKKYVSYLILLSFLFLQTGCLLGQKRSAAVLPQEGFEEGDHILDAERLKQGGLLFILPFRPGPGVAANAEISRLALFIVKGAVEELSQTDLPITIASPADAVDADLVVKGHITDFKRPRGFKKWLPGGRKLFMSVSCEMADQETGNLILIYARNQTSSRTTKDFEAMAYAIGQDLGRFIEKAVREKQ